MQHLVVSFVPTDANSFLTVLLHAPGFLWVIQCPFGDDAVHFENEFGREPTILVAAHVL